MDIIHNMIQLSINEVNREESIQIFRIPEHVLENDFVMIEIIRRIGPVACRINKRWYKLWWLGLSYQQKIYNSILIKEQKFLTPHLRSKTTRPQFGNFIKNLTRQELEMYLNKSTVMKIDPSYPLFLAPRQCEFCHNKANIYQTTFLKYDYDNNKSTRQLKKELLIKAANFSNQSIQKPKIISFKRKANPIRTIDRPFCHECHVDKKRCILRLE